jgi:hypothetical protein
MGRRYGKVENMVRMTLYLPESLKKAVERLAREEGCSQAALLREAVAKLVASRRPPRPRLPLFKGGAGTTDFAERVDEILAEGFGRD